MTRSCGAFDSNVSFQQSMAHSYIVILFLTTSVVICAAKKYYQHRETVFAKHTRTVCADVTIQLWTAVSDHNTRLTAPDLSKPTQTEHINLYVLIISRKEDRQHSWLSVDVGLSIANSRFEKEDGSIGGFGPIGIRYLLQQISGCLHRLYRPSMLRMGRAEMYLYMFCRFCFPFHVFRSSSRLLTKFLSHA